MPLDVDTSEQQHNKELAFSGGESIYLQPGDNIYRIIKGPYAVRQAFFTGKITTEEGERKNIRLSFNVEENSMFDKLAAIDKSIRTKNLSDDVAKKIRSPLDPINRYVYVVFDRSNPEIERKVLYCPFQVSSRLQKIQKLVHPKKKDKLEHCLLIMHDVVIRKLKSDDPRMKSGPGGGIHYTADFMPDNKWQGRLPAKYTSGEMSWNEVMAELNEIDKTSESGFWKHIYTKEEFELLNTKFPIEQYITPKTDEEIINQLNGDNIKFNIEATDNNGNFIYPDKKHFAEYIKKAGLLLAEYSKDTTEQQKENPVKEPPAEKVEQKNLIKDIEKNEIEDVKFEEIVNEKIDKETEKDFWDNPHG